MVNIRKGKLTRSDKKTAIYDERQLRKESEELLRQTKKDLFNPARITLRQIDQHEHEIDKQLESLERLRNNTRQGHGEYAEIRAKKAELTTWKKRLRMARHAKKLGAKNEQIAAKLKEGDRKHSNGPMKSLLGKLRASKQG